MRHSNDIDTSIPKPVACSRYPLLINNVDGLDFGVEYENSQLLKAQWKEVSHNFVLNAKGTVTAHRLYGVNKKSFM